MRIKESTKKLRVLDFDIENRPLSYWYDGNPTAEITAIAWGWHDSDEIDTILMQSDGDWICETSTLPGSCVTDTLEAYSYFLAAYEEADMVTGHYIRKHDLPIINGSLMEQGMMPLSAKLTHDTKLDLLRISGLPASQEALSCMYQLEQSKHHMNALTWRNPNRLFDVSDTRKRVIDDVRQHKELYRTLQEHRFLKAPRLWKP